MQAKLVAMFLSLFVAGGATVSYVVYKQEQEEILRSQSVITAPVEAVVEAQPESPPEEPAEQEPLPKVQEPEPAPETVIETTIIEPEAVEITAEPVVVAALEEEIVPEPAPTPTLGAARKLVASLEEISPIQPEPAGPIYPTFDIVQISPDGQTLLAGKAEPGSTVEIMIDGELLGTAVADSDGNWVYLSEVPILGGTRELGLVAKNTIENTRLESEAVVVAVFPTKPKPVQVAAVVVSPEPEPVPEPEKLDPIVQIESEPKEAEAKPEPVPVVEPVIEEVAAVVQAPAPELPTGLAVLVPKTGKAASRVLQQASGKATKTGSAKFGVQTVDYDESGIVVFSGPGVPAYDVLVYLDNEYIGQTKVANDSLWTLTPEQKIAPGSYIVRVDQVSPEGRVDARMEIPFTRDNTGRSELSKARTVIVLPGNNLWRIARVAYGEGMRYTTIYDANKNKIQNPNLIFPGQIFVVPQGE